MHLIYATGNTGKLYQAQMLLEPIGHTVEGQKVAFDEPRDNDLAVIARAKLRQAARVLNTPFFVNDSAFYIDALGGFPGIYVNFALGTIGLGGIVRLMQGVPNRRCCFKQCVGYFDGKEEHLFFSETAGTLAPEPRGSDRPEHLSPLSLLFIPDGAQCVLAELPIEELRAFYAYSDRALVQLGRFLNLEESH